MNKSAIFPQAHVTRLIDLALEEDIGKGDITSRLLIPGNLNTTAVLTAKAPGILAGAEVGYAVLLRVDPLIKITSTIKDGSRLKPGDIIARIQGNARSILKAERVVLNFLQRLSGIATLTNRYVDQVKDLPVKILDTRKTTPGFRSLEKYAVKMGGGTNHRMNLSDGVLIKDNHLMLIRKQGSKLGETVKKARQETPKDLWIEVETTNLEEVKEAVDAGADFIMLDNMSPAMMRQAIKLLRPGIKCEASGGVSLETVRTIAETGVHFISVGALTHSAEALDISLEFEA